MENYQSWIAPPPPQSRDLNFTEAVLHYFDKEVNKKQRRCPSRRLENYSEVYIYSTCLYVRKEVVGFFYQE